jgi:hypothetical protein
MVSTMLQASVPTQEPSDVHPDNMLGSAYLLQSQNAKRPLSASLPLYKGIPPALQQKIDHYRNNPDAVAQLHQRIAAFNSSNKQGAGAATTNSRTCTRSSSSAAAAAACSTDHVQQNAENVTPWPAIGGLSNLRGLVVDVELDVHGSSPSTNEVSSRQLVAGDGMGCAVPCPVSLAHAG